MDIPYGCRSLCGASSQPGRQSDFHDKFYDSLPWPPREFDSDDSNLSPLEDECPITDVPWSWSGYASRSIQKDSFGIEHTYKTALPSVVDIEAQSFQSVCNIP